MTENNLVKASHLRRMLSEIIDGIACLSLLSLCIGVMMYFNILPGSIIFEIGKPDFGLTKCFGLDLSSPVAIEFFTIFLVSLIIYLPELGGTSLGKMFCDIRITDPNGGKPTFDSLLYRLSLKAAPSAIVILAMVYGSIMLLIAGIISTQLLQFGYILTFGPQNRALHDRMSQTALYRTGPYASQPRALTMPTQYRPSLDPSRRRAVDELLF